MILTSTPPWLAFDAGFLAAACWSLIFVLLIIWLMRLPPGVVTARTSGDIRYTGRTPRLDLAIDRIRQRLLRSFQATDIAEIETRLRQRDAELEAAKHELEQLRAAAHTAEAVREDLVGGVSHELRTPLTTVIGFVEMLRMGVYGQLTTEQAQIIEAIYGSSRHLQHLIDDLLTFAILEQQVTTCRMDDIDIRTLVDEIREAHLTSSEVRGLTLHAVIDANVPRLVVDDSERISQIQACLVSSAIRYTEQGHVTIHVAHAVVVEGTTTSWLYLDVADTGIGIAPEQQAQIFVPFHKLDMSHTRRRGGTGLGLAIASRLTNLLGGTITLESTPGVGSRFRIALPVRDQR
ncbi:MAG TPA: ATP-binding protein [Roseiflexaceae bacterium]|nr:ATP-binding protein [Roseiflexaceae bacterium]